MDINYEELLAVFQSEDPRQVLMSSVNLMQYFEYYIQDDHRDYLVKAICSTDQNTLIKYVKGLISLYPLSSEILEDVIVNGNGLSLNEMEEHVADWIDVSEVMEKSFNKFCSICCVDNIEKEKSSVYENISELNDQLESLAEENRALQELKTKQKKLSEEVNKLQAECSELREKYSEENLKKQRNELKKELASLTKNKDQTEKELKVLTQKIEEAKSDDNPEFERALKALKDIMNTFPGDEADSDGKQNYRIYRKRSG